MAGGGAPKQDSPLLRLEQLSKRYGPLTAVHPVDLTLEGGDFLAILGPSGCGKSTLLRMIGGFEAVSSGRIFVSGEDVTRAPPERRPTNMVFQGYGLFPHMTVRQNVSYGLRLRRTPKPQLAEAVENMLRLVHLDPLADRPVQKLSGGQQQRVALARALVMRPAVLLLDEPLAALDLKLRRAMQEELRALHRTLGGTVIFVTHDQEEALSLASRILVMEAGHIVQDGAPRDIYRAPTTQFVSAFIGEANLLPGLRRGNAVTLDCGPSFIAPGADGRVRLLVRPEQARLEHVGRLRGTVTDMIFLGAFSRLTLRLQDGSDFTVQIPEPAASPEPGMAVAIDWDDTEARILDDP